MIKIRKLVLIALLPLTVVFFSCDVLLQTANSVLNSEQPLTAADVANGLKEALKVGTDSAVTRIGKQNGYLLDPIIKINLPPQVSEVVKHAQKVPGIDKMINDIVVQINRSAEDAAKQAAPIFKNAITSMTIADAWGILNGADTAATHYLRDKTYNQLYDLYNPIMKNSLNKPIVAGVSAQKTWSELTGRWNDFATSLPGKILNAQAITISLDEFVTHQALNGAFIKVGDQEKEIRTNVNARVTDLLRRVFAKR
jgi:hypothetical protein